MERVPWDGALWYWSELGARAAAAGGHARHAQHLGRLLLLALGARPAAVAQVDGGAGRAETCASVLARSVACAGALRASGVRRGDVVVLMAPNHLDMLIPFYAALYLGAPVAPVDRTLTVQELQAHFLITCPRIVFCESERAPDVQRALNALESSAELVAFDGGHYLLSFADFLARCPAATTPDTFQAEELDPAEALAVLLPTSGTTGAPKVAAATHANYATTLPYLWSRHEQFPTPTRALLVCSPLQWLTAVITALQAPLMGYTRLATSRPLTTDHFYHLLRVYKPTFTILSPTLMSALLAGGGGDLSCLETVMLGGSAVPLDLIQQVKSASPDTEVFNVYGITELTSLALQPSARRPAAAGTPLGCFRYRLVDVETQEEVAGAGRPGELWVRGPGVFQGYYRDAAATAAALAPGGWFRTGDLFTRDDDYHFYFVERIKLLLKYMSHHISPVELEQVIRAHPGVLDVAVTGVRDARGDLPVACVVRHPAHRPPLSAQDVKDIVAANLSDAKQLRGGVIFIEELPMTASTKIHRRKLQEIVQIMERE